VAELHYVCLAGFLAFAEMFPASRFSFFFESSIRTAAAIFAASILYRLAACARFESFDSGCRGIVAGAVQVGYKRAHDKEVLYVRRAHFAHGLPGDRFVIHAVASPRSLGLSLLPTVNPAEAPVIVMIEALKVIERGHFDVGTR
jgi:hypothetical protein